MKRFYFSLLGALLPALLPLAAQAQDAFDYTQKQFENTFTVRGVTRTTTCQAVRIHKNWFLTAAHCVSPCKNYECTLRLWLAIGPVRAAAQVARQRVFLPEAYQDEYTQPPGKKPESGLPLWDVALIRFVPDSGDFAYFDAYGTVKKEDFLKALDAAFWEKKAEELSRQVTQFYARARQAAENGETELAAQLTQAAQETETDIDEARAAAEAAPELKKQWDGAFTSRLAPLLAYTQAEEFFLKSNILVPRWTRGAFERRSSPKQVVYLGDRAAGWLSAGFGVTKGNSGGGVFLPVYNGGKKRTSGLVGVVSAKNSNQLPEEWRRRYELYGPDLFMFVGFSEGSTLGFIRQVMEAFREEPAVRPLTRFGRVEAVKKEGTEKVKA